MSIISKIINESLLVEISLKDHFENYISSKFNISFEDYEKIAKLDPTTKNEQKGKYVEWLLKMNKIDPDMDIPAFRNSLKEYLPKFIKVSSGKDINEFKTIKDFLRYVDTLPDISNKEQKRQEKNIFNRPEDIKIIDVMEEWIIAQPLTKEGSIALARWKSDKSAKWCTADPDTDVNWNYYTRKGDLLIFLNRKDGFEKYQIFVVNGKIEESRDFNDRVDNTPRQIIKDSKNIEYQYGYIEERSPFKYIFDEEGTARYFLSEDFDDMSYLNREPDEDEYDYYYEEAIENAEFQINHWDRVINEGFIIYDDEIEHKYRDIENRMDNFVNFFKNPDDNSMAEDADIAVYDYYSEFEELWNDWIEEFGIVKPLETNFKSRYEFENEYNLWYENELKEFLEEYEHKWKYIQEFLKVFPYNFKFDENIRINNSEDQLSLNFQESLLAKLTESIYADEIDTNLKYENNDIPTKETEFDTINRTEKSTARVLTFDKIKINQMLKEQISDQVKEFPYEQIKNILEQFGYKIIKNGTSFETDGDSGDYDYELFTTTDKPITNSVLICMWNKNENGLYYFNSYIS